MPGRAWYLIAVLVALFGIGCAALFFWLRFDGLTEALIRVAVPGEGSIGLGPGTYTVFHGYSGGVDGRLYEVRNISGQHVEITNPIGKTRALRDAANTRYGLPGHNGASLLEIDADPQETTASKLKETVLAVGQGFI